MKYYCYDCGKIMDEDELLTKTVEYSHGELVDEAICPYCGSDEVDEAKVCELCGEAMPTDKLGECCEDCEIELGAYFRKMVEDVALGYGIDEERAKDIIVEFIAEKF